MIWAVVKLQGKSKGKARRMGRSDRKWWGERAIKLVLGVLVLWAVGRHNTLTTTFLPPLKRVRLLHTFL
ncbi:MAG: hypothetical protein JOZ63_14430 [Planctomycetaceae bacterium]|nr:hypothetical protein [Planctomycetaceae bacterium]